MRLASYNVENLFSRAKILNQNQWVGGGSSSRMVAARVTLNTVAQLNALLAEPVYTSTIKAKILDALRRLDLLRSDESEFLILRRNRGVCSSVLRIVRSRSSPTGVPTGLVGSK